MDMNLHGGDPASTFVSGVSTWVSGMAMASVFA